MAGLLTAGFPVTNQYCRLLVRHSQSLAYYPLLLTSRRWRKGNQIAGAHWKWVACAREIRVARARPRLWCTCCVLFLCVVARRSCTEVFNRKIEKHSYRDGSQQHEQRAKKTAAEKNMNAPTQAANLQHQTTPVKNTSRKQR